MQCNCGFGSRGRCIARAISLVSLNKTKFAAMHLLQRNHHQLGIGSSKVSQGLIFLVQSTNPEATGHPIYYGEFNENNCSDHNEQCIQEKLRLINHPLLRTCLRKCGTSALLGSSNGLVCLVESRKRDIQAPFHICNPITRECLFLQGFNKNNEYDDLRVSRLRIHSGFGYSPQTNEYKVVRILYNPTSRREDIQVYTLGAGSGWRSKGVSTGSWLYSMHGVCFKGAIHWLGEGGKVVIVFNLSDEKFHVLPGPTGHSLEPAYQFHRILESFGEWLCVSGGENCQYFSQRIDIWTYRYIGSYEAGSWCKEFSINLEPRLATAWCFKPLAVTKSGLVLLQSKDPDHPTYESNPYERTLFCYDPKTETLKRHENWKFVEAIPHTNSFVSLEDFGEKTCFQESISRHAQQQEIKINLVSSIECALFFSGILIFSSAVASYFTA